MGFEPTISAGEWPQTYALDRLTTGTGIYLNSVQLYSSIEWTAIWSDIHYSFFATKTGNFPLKSYLKLGNGKAVPLQAWSGLEGSRKLRFPDFMTTAQDSGKVVSLMHRPPLPPGNAPGTHFC